MWDAINVFKRPDRHVGRPPQFLRHPCRDIGGPVSAAGRPEEWKGFISVVAGMTEDIFQTHRPSKFLKKLATMTPKTSTIIN